MRKSAELTIGTTKFRVVEPAPIKAYRVIQWAELLLAPLLTKILSGQLTDLEVAVCPRCGSTNTGMLIGDRQWMCKYVKPEDDDGSEHPRACGTIWPQVATKAEGGGENKVTIAFAFSSPRWRAVLALELVKASQRLAAEELEAFMLEVLLGACEVVFAEKGHAINTPAELEQYVPSGSGLKRLLHAAMEAWVLPTLADAYPMRPASSPAVTPGDSQAPTPPVRLHTPGPPPTSTHR